MPFDPGKSFEVLDEAPSGFDPAKEFSVVEAPSAFDPSKEFSVVTPPSPPDPYNAIGRGMTDLTKIEKGSFNEAFKPPQIVADTLDKLFPSFKPESPEIAQLVQMAGLEPTRQVAEAVSERIKGAIGSMLSPGGAVLALAAPAAPELAGGLAAVLGGEGVASGAKEALAGVAKDSPGMIAGGVTTAVLGGAMAAAGTAGMVKGVSEAISRVTPETAKALAETTNERTPNATQEGQVKEDIQRERAGVNALGTAAEAGSGDSLRGQAEVATGEAPVKPVEPFNEASDKPVRIYRGEGGSKMDSTTGGQWFTTDLEKAKSFGNVSFIDTTVGEIQKLAAQGHGGPDELVVSPSLAERAKPLTGQMAVAPHTTLSPESERLGITPAVPALIANLTDAVKGSSDYLKGAVRSLMGKSMPRTTAVDQHAGELGVRWASSRIAAPYAAKAFSDATLEGKVDPVKFGAALTEDNLRSVKQAFEEAGDAEKASAVTSVIGAKNSPFRTEAEYQTFLADPETQAAIDRHKALWDESIDPMYKAAMEIDPDAELPSRGLQTGARINLFGADPDAPISPNRTTVGGASLTATFKKRTPFGIAATGTGPYGINYAEMMENTFGKQLSIANQNAFNKALVEGGNAVISRPGQTISLGGENTTAFPLSRVRVISKGEEGTRTFSQAQNIYVKNSLAGEYVAAANPFGSVTRGGKIVSAIGGAFNKMALAGLTDATVHLSNLSTVLFTRPGSGNLVSDIVMSGMGRADIPVTLTKALAKSLQNNTAQLGELAEIGALRAPHTVSNFGLGKVIQWADRTTRLVLDDTYKELAAEGVVENSETARREFVNQVGQYNSRLQGFFTRTLRQTGMSPFITAGKTFATLGVRNMTLDPGVAGSGLNNAMLLRADIAAKWVGTVGILALANYMLTKDKGGGVMGRPGVPIGRLDTGMANEDGNPLTLPFLDIVGFGRGLRVTGVGGTVNALRNDLPLQVALDAGARDIENSLIAPLAGPLPRAVLGAATGMPAATKIGRIFPVVPPGKSQTLSDAKNAAIEANPVVASLHDLAQEGGGAKALARQLPRFTLQPSKPPEMMENYAEIVHRAQLYTFTDDVVHRARKMLEKDRGAYVESMLEKLDDPKDRETLRKTLKSRKVRY